MIMKRSHCDSALIIFTEKFGFSEKKFSKDLKRLYITGICLQCFHDMITMFFV